MHESISPITKKVYKIPKEIDDSAGINDFLQRNINKKVVVVQGLGFVGAVMSIICANALSEEYAVVGIDLPNQNSFWKIKSINEGIFPLIADDPKIDTFFEKAIKKGNLYATYDPLIFSHADIVIVDINLDVEKISEDNYELKDFSVNLDGFKAAISSIGCNMKEDALIIVETTVPPGTCLKVVKPIIDNELSKREMKVDKYKLGHSYERVMPGPDYINSIRCFPRVYSGIDERSSDSTEIFLKTIIDTKECKLTRLSDTNATEIAKVLENSYRATNIAFAVEWSRFAEEAGVDLFSIVNAIRVRETHANLMYPGIGVGGYCLTKDPLLASWSRKNLFGSSNDLDMSVNSVSINDQMPRYTFERLKDVFGSVKSKKIAILGISYRGDVGDTRFSPVEPLFYMLKNAEADIFVHDPYLNQWSEVGIVVENDIDKVFSNDLDVIIISTGHSLYKTDRIIKKITALSELEIFDTIGILKKYQLKELKSHHKVSVLGSGS